MFRDMWAGTVNTSSLHTHSGINKSLPRSMSFAKSTKRTHISKVNTSLNPKFRISACSCEKGRSKQAEMQPSPDVMVSGVHNSAIPPWRHARAISTDDYYEAGNLDAKLQSVMIRDAKGSLFNALDRKHDGR